jgi:hypothetical protein
MAVKNRIQPGDGDPRHGKPWSYNNHGCRCDECTETHRISHYEWEHADPARLARHAQVERDRRRRDG